MYALRYPLGSYTYGVLVELTRAQRASLTVGEDSLSDGRFIYSPCSATYAHQWVRDNGHHETRLWIDHDNRVRV